MPQQAAETIFTNGEILTGSGLRSNTPVIVRSLAIRDGRILAVGELAVAQWRGPESTVIDLHGAFAMPGFNDAHLHLNLAGRQRLSLDLRPSRSLPEMLAQIETHSRHLPPREWLLGGGWDHTQWPEPNFPSRNHLDQVTGDRPALLHRIDLHLAVANSAALHRAGIDAATGDPPGAHIDRDPSGKPTGILREAAAIALVHRVVPPPTVAQRRQSLRSAMLEAVAHGVTSVQDNSDWEDFPILQAMQRDADLPVRVAEWMDFTRPLDELLDRRHSHPSDDSYLHLTHLKGFLDGSLGSRTAAMLAPYTDDPTSIGLPRFEPDHLLDLTRERLREHFPIAFHAIGDRANRLALDTFTQAHAVEDLRQLRCRIEHAQVVAPADQQRFAPLGIVASMQPSHLLGDLPWAAARLGPHRQPFAYPWNSLQQAGALLAFGTDFPVEPVNPMPGLYAAVTRRSVGGGPSFEPNQRLTIHQALHAYTQGSAFAEFRESSKGVLQPGFLADLVVLSHNPLLVSPQDLLHIAVLRTVIGGATVFCPAEGIGPPAPWQTPWQAP